MAITNSPQRFLKLVLIAAALVLIDQASKLFFSPLVTTTLNNGISFGWFSQVPPPILNLLLLGVLVVLMFFLAHRKDVSVVAAGLIVGGGISNVLDRIWHGGVRDWLPVPLLPLQNNLADYGIAAGVLWLLWQLYARGTIATTRDD